MARILMGSQGSEPLLIDCRGLQVVESAAWNTPTVQRDNIVHGRGRNKNWGFIICRDDQNPASGSPALCSRIIGTIGPVNGTLIEEICLGVPMTTTINSKTALIQFALASGLSILDQTHLEIGDNLVLSGINSLALSVLTAAQTRGLARIICIVPPSEAELASRRNIEKAMVKTIEYSDLLSFESLFNESISSLVGKTAFIDTTGNPHLVFSMLTKLKTFENLTLCRQDSDSELIFDICKLHHLKSAQFVYWSRVEGYEDALKWHVYLQRAGRLLKYRPRETALLEILNTHG